MGYTKPQGVSETMLSVAPLPNHGKTYTVIPHSSIIKYTEDLLDQNGFTIKKKTFKSNTGHKVAQGIYHISSKTSDEELGMMFAWTNSYDKSTRFQCGIGAYVFVCNNGLIHGDMASFSRKHTGSADIEAKKHIQNQIIFAHKYFKQLITDKNSFRTIQLSKKEQSELLGRLFVEKEILDATQMSSVKREMNKPSFDYSCDQDNAWAFYNHVTNSLKLSHPRKWMTDQQNFHKFMTSELLTQMNSNNNNEYFNKESLKQMQESTLWVPQNGIYPGDLRGVEKSIRDSEDNNIHDNTIEEFKRSESPDISGFLNNDVDIDFDLDSFDNMDE